PGHDMYYLNVMAGPGETREWRICFHPDHTEGCATSHDAPAVGNAPQPAPRNPRPG
ncbi:5-deoxy-glucuronate isomerase, partial [Streptomyces sp. NPDC051014]|uniref:5-deoxy-glucuronate isomerase n=1 Tax=Streptomyces sp. NPDC051014 TaxID=3155751 RepID=UPI0033D9EA8D